MKEITTIELANYIKNYYVINELEFTDCILQRLIYYIQVWNIAYFKHQLINELPIANVNGPYYKSVGFNSKNKLSTLMGKDFLELTDNQLELIDEVLKKYSTLDEFSLVLLAQRDLPWNITRGNIGPLTSCDEIISFDIIYDFYSKYKN